MLLLAACSDKVTSLDGAKRLSDLQPAEARQLCEDVHAYRLKRALSAADLVKVGCRMQAVTSASYSSDAKDDTGQRASCRKAFEKCVAADEKLDIKTNADCDRDGLAELSKCNDVTVAELTACVEETIAMTKSLVDRDACEDVTGSSSLTIVTKLTTGPSCAGIAARCRGASTAGESSQAPPEQRPAQRRVHEQPAGEGLLIAS
jgi:hypothetical protein